LVSFPLAFPRKPYIYIFPPPLISVCTICLAHLILLGLIILIIFGKSRSCEAPHYAVSSKLLFNNFRSKYSPKHPVFRYSQSALVPLNVRDRVSHPYETTGKIIVLSILVYTFINRRGDRGFWNEW
jgi:hypothetical protein